MTRLQKMGTIKKGVLLLILIAIFAFFVLRGGNELEDVAVNSTPEVALINVGEASTDSSPLSVTGTVRSETEAQLRTETQGEVIGVYTEVGRFVSAGTVIAEIRNTAERAAVQQAQASVEAARANLAKATGGVRSEEQSILEINVTNAEKTLSTSKVSALNAIDGGFASVDDAVSARTDGLFSNVDTANPSFRLSTSESQIVNSIVQDRIAIATILKRHVTASQTLTANSELESEIAVLKDELLFVQNYLDDVLTAINNAIPSASVDSTAIAGFKADATAARAAVNGSISTLTGALNVLNGAEAGLEIAKKNLEQGLTGAQDEDVTALEAAVAQAEAGLTQARANLARTLIITPINGTVNTLSLRRGDFVSAFSPAAIVSNNNALEVQAFVTSSDKNDIRVGSRAFIDGQYEGVITSVAPGLDPVTKKVEVKIGVVDTDTTLTNGASVRADIDRNGFEEEISEPSEITIPISALKIETNRVIVFTVDGTNMLVAHVVEPGLILGDSVRIESGLTTDMAIVRDARGLREAQEVVIAQN